MMAQILLTLALVAILLYAVAQRPKIRVFRLSIALLSLGGLVVVWAPELSTRIANLLGIGRGADLISYIWIVMSLILAINVHIRLRLESERVTQLAREIAIINARLPK